MPFRSENTTPTSEPLIPDMTVPAPMVWVAAAALGAAAVVGLIMGLRQTPAVGGGPFGEEVGLSPTAAQASAAAAKPLTGDKWSTLSGPQVVQPAPDAAKTKPAAAPPSEQPPAARSAASAEAPPEAPPPQPQAAPSEPEPQQAPTTSSQPDSIQNYY